MTNRATNNKSEVLAEEPGFTVTDFNASEYETYSVQSVRLGYRSPASNVIFVDAAGITGVEADEPLVVYGYEGTLRFVCSAPQTGVRVYDVAGVPAAAIDCVQPNDEILIAPGVYLKVTAQCRRPGKVVVK